MKKARFMASERLRNHKNANEQGVTLIKVKLSRDVCVAQWTVNK